MLAVFENSFFVFGSLEQKKWLNTFGKRETVLRVPKKAIFIEQWKVVLEF